MARWRSMVTEHASAREYRIDTEDRPLRYDEVIDLWRGDEGFRTFFTELLADAPFDAFFWETPPITSSTTDRPFEFVLTESRILAGVTEDRRPFAEHFEGSRDVVTFDNLGGDARLVVPTPGGGEHTHLAAFLRTAPTERCSALWRVLGETIPGCLSSSPRWISTAGTGVYWLHIRLDSRPKYYTWTPYTQTGS